MSAQKDNLLTPAHSAPREWRETVRRSLFVVLTLAVAALCPATVPEASAGREPRPGFLNVVAHEDDDLLFMSPDLSQSIQAGSPSVTVYTTSAEASHSPDVTPEDYAAMRQAGERNAYAAMAGVPNIWERTAIVTPAGTTLELATLRGRPDVRLVFLRLHDYWDLRSLWYGWVGEIGTVLPTGSPAAKADVYTRQTLVDTLTWLMKKFSPTVVRTQNPEPIAWFVPGDEPYDPDNIDHTATARYTEEAVKAYHGPNGDGRVEVRNYRGYDEGQLPTNLSPAQRAVRDKYFLAYTAVDAHVRELQDTIGYVGLRQSIGQRWPSGTTWTAQNLDGTFEAYSVQDGNVTRWRQDSRGAWGKPVSIGGGPLAPYVTTARNADGRIQLFALNRDTFDVVTAVQTTSGGTFSAWTSLGNPNGEGGTMTGLPAVAADGNGRLQLFTRNGGSGISSKVQNADGSFGDWIDLHGWGVQDGLSAVTDAGGRIRLFTTHCDNVGSFETAWCAVGVLAQDEIGGAFTWLPDIATHAAQTGPTAVRDAGGRLRVYFRDAVTAEVVATSGQADGTWTAPVSLGDPGGIGEVAASGTDVFTRNAAHGLSRAAKGTWTDLGGFTEQPPATAFDRSGKLILLSVGADGILRWRSAEPAGRWVAAAR